MKPNFDMTEEEQKELQEAIKTLKEYWRKKFKSPDFLKVPEDKKDEELEEISGKSFN